MGATTYRVMSGYAAEGEPGTDASGHVEDRLLHHAARASFLAEHAAHARDAVEAVREMKDRGSKSMRTIGRLTLCRSPLNAGLVDRFRVVSFPSSPEAAAGSGSTTAIPMLLST